VINRSKIKTVSILRQILLRDDPGLGRKWWVTRVGSVREAFNVRG
jgi:hypothetical protein